MTPTYLNLVTEGHQLMLDLEPPTKPSSISDFARASMIKLFSAADGIGAKWLVVLECGEVLGTLDYVPQPSPDPNKKIRRAKVDRGETRAYWLPIIRRAKLKPLQTVEVPYDARWDRKLMAGHISSWASNEKSRFGRKYTTSRDEEKGCVEVMRLPDGTR